MSDTRVAWRDGGAGGAELIGSELSTLLTAGVEVQTLRAVGLVAGLDTDRIIASLQSRALLAWSSCDLRAVPLGNWVPVPVVKPASGRLSRFAHVRLLEGSWILESALSPWRVHLPEGPLSLDAEQDGARGAWLSALRMLDDGDAMSRDWAFHDRLFRARWRWDTSAPETGADAAAPPALRAMDRGRTVSLPVPTGPEPDEPTLWSATESRRTYREFSDQAVPVEALATLLWRVLRVTSQEPGVDVDGRPFEALKRPVPASGSLHSIDVWLLTRAVDGIEAAWWWYDPVQHALVHVGAATDVGNVSSADGVPVFGVLTSRHARTAWKYPAYSHALELRDTGVIFHALQVSAVASGLGVWPLGTGADRPIAAALGIDLEADAPVGEFGLGVIPSTSSQTRA